MKLKKSVFYGEKLSNIYFRGFNPTCDNINKLLDLVSHKYLLGVFTALDTQNELIRAISKDYDNYDVLLPPDNSITSQTIIVAKKQNFVSLLPSVLASEPRCLTFYGLYNKYDLHGSINKQTIAELDSIVSVGNSITDISISVVVDEFYAEISLASCAYDTKIFWKNVETVSFD